MEPRSTQSRSIRPAGALAVVMGSMVGIGIFLTPPLVAAATDSATAFFAMWIAGGVVALAGAAAFSELGAMLPRAGGDYVFQRAAFGSSVAFASGAIIYGVSFAGSIAAMSAATSTFQLPVLLDVAPEPRLAALILVVVLTAINTVGVRLAVAVQITLTSIPVALLAVLAVIALATGVQGTVPPEPSSPVSAVNAWLAVYFAYAGWPAVIYLAGEVRDPGRTLPIATVGGTVLVTGLYVLLCGAMVSAFGLDGLARLGEAGSPLAGAVLGPAGARAMAALVFVALLASINGTILGGARVGWIMATEGALPAWLGTLNAAGVPARALWIQAGLAAGFLFSGTFETMVAASSLAMLLAGAITVSAVVRLRSSRPDAHRPYRTWSPWVPGLYVTAAVIAIVASLWLGSAQGLVGLLAFGALFAVHRLRAV